MAENKRNVRQKAPDLSGPKEPGPMPQSLAPVAETAQAGAGSVPVAANALLTVDDMAALLRCSPRTVYRLSERGRIPRPCRLGSLLRWTRVQVDEWVARGCPDCRNDIRKN